MLAEATTSPLHSRSAMVYEITTEQVLLEKNADEIAPLASPDAHTVGSVSHKGGLRRASATVSATKTHGSAARQPLKRVRAHSRRSSGSEKQIKAPPRQRSQPQIGANPGNRAHHSECTGGFDRRCKLL